MIKFGTDGWRAVIAEDFTFANLRRVAWAIGRYLVEQDGGKKDRSLVIGYDGRFLSPEFAQAAGEVLAAQGIPVLIVSAPTPTPVTAFAICHYRAQGAIMITASHNPPRYNGIKFIPGYAGPAMPQETQAIEAYLAQAGDQAVSVMPRAEAEKAGLWREIDPRSDYLKHLSGLVKVETWGQRPLRVVVDPLYGAGSSYLGAILEQAGCEVTGIHMQRDPLFGEILPDPSLPTSLDELAQWVREEDADLGLAVDGDGDRFGVIDRGGRFFSPNEIHYLLAYYLVSSRGWQGRALARTVATTHMLDRVAQHFQGEILETPVGFKYIGQALREQGAVYGGEESGGMSMAGHVPEKDGILATSLVAEAVAATGMSLEEQRQAISRELGRLVSWRWDVEVSPNDKREILQALSHYHPQQLAGLTVAERKDLDGTKLILADGSWVLVRPSGTEPVFRVYVEAENEGQRDAIYRAIISDLNLAR
ncbi:MAG: phosphoglucomutase/phosphomannomutase family protein [Clostridia bacterium]|nr:phosphoglucomutase/phosphomannomutase family protein [Clostridia bacterium]